MRIGDFCKTNLHTYSEKEKWSEIHYLDTGNITRGKVDEIQILVPGKDTIPSRARRKVQIDDIVYSTVRPNQRHYGIIKNFDPNMLVSTGFVVITVDQQIADSDFIYYFLTQDDITETLQAIGEQSTSAYPSIKPVDIENLEIELPSLEEQRAVGAFLRLLDEKCAANDRINDNLLVLATALFDQTIVKYTPYLTMKSIDDIAEVKGGKRLPKGVNLQTIPNAHPYIRVRDLNDACVVQLSSEFEYVDDETQKGIARYIVHTSDVIVSIVGTIGLTALVHESLDMANLTENCVKITNLKETTPEYLLLFLRSVAGQTAIQQGTVGAVQAKLPIKNIQTIMIPVIPEDQCKTLYSQLKSIFAAISARLGENASLMQIRDSLLPRLMSGEIDVSDINI